MVQVLRSRAPLLALQAASCVSWLGDNMSSLALPWFVFQTTGSLTQTGLAALARAMGVYIATALSGPYVDQVSGKRLSIACDVLAGLSTLAIPLLSATQGLVAWQLYMLIVLASVVQRPGFLARSRSLPEIADASGVSLERASGLNEVLYQATLLVGPAAAGVLIVLVGSSWVLTLDALTFLLSAIVIGAGVPSSLMSVPQMIRTTSTRLSYWVRFGEGVRFLRKDRLILAMIVTVSLGILLVNAPLLSVMLQVYARDRWGTSVELGLLFSCFAVGALAGAALYTWIGSMLSGRWLWLTAYALIALPYLAIVLDLPIVVLAGCLGLFGLAEGLSTPFYATVRFRRVPPELRARAFSALVPITGLAPTLGLLIPSLLLAPLGIVGVAAVLLGGTVIVWLWLVLSPTFHHLDEKPGM